MLCAQMLYIYIVIFVKWYIPYVFPLKFMEWMQDVFVTSSEDDDYVSGDGTADGHVDNDDNDDKSDDSREVAEESDSSEDEVCIDFIPLGSLDIYYSRFVYI